MEKDWVKRHHEHLCFSEVSKVSSKAEGFDVQERAKSNRYQINASVNGGFVNVQLVAT